MTESSTAYLYPINHTPCTPLTAEPLQPRNRQAMSTAYPVGRVIVDDYSSDEETPQRRASQRPAVRRPKNPLDRPLSVAEVERLAALDCFELAVPREEFPDQLVFEAREVQGLLRLAPYWRLVVLHMRKTGDYSFDDGVELLDGQAHEVRQLFLERFFGSETFLLEWRLRTVMRIGLLFKVPHNCRLRRSAGHRFDMVQFASEQPDGNFRKHYSSIWIEPFSRLSAHGLLRALRDVKRGTADREPIYPHILLHALKTTNYSLFVSASQYKRDQDEKEDALADALSTLQLDDMFEATSITAEQLMKLPRGADQLIMWNDCPWKVLAKYWKRNRSQVMVQLQGVLTSGRACHDFSKDEVLRVPKVTTRKWQVQGISRTAVQLLDPTTGEEKTLQGASYRYFADVAADLQDGYGFEVELVTAPAGNPPRMVEKIVKIEVINPQEVSGNASGPVEKKVSLSLR